MTEIMIMKTLGGALVPCDPQAAEFIQKMKVGAGVRAKVSKTRNTFFHRKFFALLNHAFDAWEPAQKEYKGIAIQKNFEQFREDVTILAGFYEMNVRLDGSIRFSAKSISFASMSQDEFENLYSAVINVILSRILTNYTRGDLENVINQILSFS